MSVAVVIPYRGTTPERERAYKAVSKALRGMLPDAVHLAVDSGHEPFNRAASRNLGVRLAGDAGCDVVVLCDADTIPQKTPLLAAIDGAREDGRLHTPFNRFLGLTEQGAHDYLQGAPVEACEVELDYAWSVGGVFVIRPDAWAAAGGMDERFTVWGSEDVAFVRAADTLLGQTLRHPGHIVHLWHPPAQRVGTPANDAVWDLAARYAQADRDANAMRALIAERG
ncbi:galactosyltransferase-related protein [Sphaerisporangium sp. TRM90804]|uniref:galactosyltransferase-related protein n=1 Tax=Sphaerisporangium sp. TRM90804 TaxID=3031113 RepID=UPI00244AE4CE|nr:galactosyltransferase-related protein [Sphaerisporangium sp. TRM90804]MDH2424761.1 galactosyltransferase-related protein [Sphaerisporangium sp. TRM90804]